MNVSRFEKTSLRRLLNPLAGACFLLLAIASPTVSAGENRGGGVNPRGTEAELFGFQEIRSSELAAFTKWTGMLARLRAEAPAAAPLDFIRSGDELAELDAVNSMVNTVHYVPDEQNWGAADHWATPGEFYARNGDCEDFAIAKYVALKALGFDPAKMRIVVLVDRQRQKHHAVLMIDTEMGRMILDNQIAEVVRDTEIAHYDPIYSINESAWWLHIAKPRKRLVAHGNP